MRLLKVGWIWKCMLSFENQKLTMLYVSKIIYVPVESLETLKIIELLRRQKIKAHSNFRKQAMTHIGYDVCVIIVVFEMLKVVFENTGIVSNYSSLRYKYKSNYTLVVNRNFKLLLSVRQSLNMILSNHLCNQPTYCIYVDLYPQVLRINISRIYINVQTLVWIGMIIVNSCKCQSAFNGFYYVRAGYTGGSIILCSKFDVPSTIYPIK
ncbi:hypothetical protein AGLY_004785 [Aphis glycines]|uniref:Uncharacterized protein n=1 Tax=Aphis glycines TaxID=307491 RepID=A0A6G0TXA0_APHGL|nr:hypothetical protein AGLY_004785 [Aphis glycines]